jgi:magnesium transporter
MSRNHPTLDALSHLVHNALGPVSGLRVVGRLVRQAGKPMGTPPGTVVHTGRRRVEEARIRAVRYGPEEHQEEEWDGIPDPIHVPLPGEGVLWVNVDGLHDVALLEKLGTVMGFHPLAVEDVASVGQRPKLEEYEDHLYIVAHMLSATGRPVRIHMEQVSFLVGPGYVFSFQEAPGDVFDPVRERLQSGRGKIRSRGADYLAYALLDALVDSYFVVLERLGERTEELEEEVIDRPTGATVAEVHELKRELLVLRRAVWPLRETVSSFLRVEPPLVERATLVYLRDVYDHCYQVMDSVDVLRDIASGMRDLYLSTVSTRTNEVMKVLTIMASIFIPLTFVAGVYGMNFEYMPELGMRWAYPAVLVVMLGATLGMLWMFRRKGWI